MLRSERFADWKVRWLRDGFGPWQLRVVDEPMVRALRGRPNILLSVQRYAEDVLDLPEDEVIGSDCVASFFIDFDAHDQRIGLLQVTRKALAAAAWLQELVGLTDDGVRVWFSGRGLHLAVPAELIQDSPHPFDGRKFSLLARHMAKTLGLYAEVRELDENHQPTTAKVSLVDAGIYGTRQLIRMPGTANPNSRYVSGLPKFRLPIEALRRLAGSRNGIEFRSLLMGLVAEEPWTWGEHDERWRLEELT